MAVVVVEMAVEMGVVTVVVRGLFLLAFQTMMMMRAGAVTL